VSDRTPADLSDALLSKLEVLEIEAARLVILSKTDSVNTVLGTSASVVYETVTVLREDVMELLKRSNGAYRKTTHGGI